MNVSYTCLAPDGHIPADGVAYTILVTENIMADVDTDGTLLGIEVLGDDGDWLDGLAALAISGRLYIRLHN
jgi:uncharacterized protein YuzE